MDEVPAAYALKYYEKRLVELLISGDNLGMVRDGYQSLWSAVSGGMNVRLNTPVLKVRRPDDGGQVEVMTALSSDSYDHLIVTCMPEDASRFLDLRVEEAGDFSKMRRYFYYTVAVEIPAHFAATGFLSENYSQKRTSHSLCWFKRWNDGNIAIFYALSKVNLSKHEIIQTLFRDSALYQWNLGAVRSVKAWKYFPHFVRGSTSVKIFYQRTVSK